MRMISCVSPVSSGTLSVYDMDVRRSQRDVKKLLGSSHRQTAWTLTST